MNNRQLFGGRIMGVGIFIIRLSMSCPTGVPHSNGARKILPVKECFQFAYLAFLFINVECFVKKGNARAIIAAIL